MNEEIKATFFAQYAYQNLLIISPNYPESICENTLGMIEIANTNSYLLLRSINDLSDEECEAVAKLLTLKSDEYFCSNLSNGFNRIKFVRNFLLKFVTVRDSYVGPAQYLYSAIEFLKRIGVCMPFTFLNDQNQPETYSVEKLVELGWITIKPNN